MSGIQRCRLPDGTNVVWAVPLSGMGHVADEQPLPYIQRRGVELTPRFGGEEQQRESGLTSLPVPYGYLAGRWPWRQRIFNFPRRRINIYWRNIFKDATRKDRLFHFIEQLEFIPTSHGFAGSSPLLKYRRSFQIGTNCIDVSDVIEFREDLHFAELYLCPWADFQTIDSSTKCHIQPTITANYFKPIKSSTGAACWHAHKVLDAKYRRGDRLTWEYKYLIK